jgi:hypothetical protein
MIVTLFLNKIHSQVQSQNAVIEARLETLVSERMKERLVRGDICMLNYICLDLKSSCVL